MPNTTNEDSLQLSDGVYANDGTKMLDAANKQIVAAGGKSAVVVLALSGAITIPTMNTTYHLTTAGALTMTLANPANTAAMNGVRLTFVADTAQAHVVDNSAGAGFNGQGASKDVATWSAAIANGFTVEANGGIWWTVGTLTGVTLG